MNYCLDTSIFIKYLCPDEQEEKATELVINALSERLVLPGFAWAEIASVLRKKVRSKGAGQFCQNKNTIKKLETFIKISTAMFENLRDIFFFPLCS